MAAPTRPVEASPAARDLGPEYAPVDDMGGRSQPRRREPEFEVPPPPLGLVALYDLWKRTKGTLSLDLRRRQLKGGAPGDSLWRLARRDERGAAASPGSGGRRRRVAPAWGYGQAGPPPAQGGYYGGQPAGYRATPPGAYASSPAGRPYSSSGGGWYGGGSGSGSRAYAGGLVDLPDVSFMDSGARIKVMRHIQFGPKLEVARPSGLRKLVPALDLGVGLSFEVDTAELQPQARLKFRDIVSVRALPYPALKIQKRLALPDSSWGVRLSYECPLDALDSFWRPPARLMLSIDNFWHTNGVQLTQAGLEFNYAGDLWEGNTTLRASGLVSLPRELPVEEGQPLVGLDIKRLGLKTAW